jgi:hypothetical protein
MISHTARRQDRTDLSETVKVIRIFHLRKAKWIPNLDTKVSYDNPAPLLDEGKERGIDYEENGPFPIFKSENKAPHLREAVISPDMLVDLRRA